EEDPHLCVTTLRASKKNVENQTCNESRHLGDGARENVACMMSEGHFLSFVNFCYRSFTRLLLERWRTISNAKIILKIGFAKLFCYFFQKSF
ncbi:MAG: hypothetical protein II791_02475, partial [Bacteroidales bacterium]|nr:hypothetical protein [Bacteroidales bacterium]